MKISEDWLAVILGFVLIIAVYTRILALPWDKW